MAPPEQFLSAYSASLMSDKPKKHPPIVNLVRSTYQPNKSELEEPIEFPKNTTPEDLARAVVESVKIDWKHRPE